ncbi:MAG: lipopolysaccharide heptosyltransferase II [Chlamydiota bacterium]
MKKIIVRMPNWLGDAVMATPVLEGLHRQWPKAEITALSRGAGYRLLEGNPYITDNITFSPDKALSKQQVVEHLKDSSYDLGVLLTNSFSSAWWFWLGGVKQRLGYAGNWRSPLLTIAQPFPAERHHQHLVLTYQHLLGPLGIPFKDNGPRLYLKDEELIRARESLTQKGIEDDNIIIGVNPAAAYGWAKCWLPDRFRQLTERLLEVPKVKVVYFGDVSGAPLVSSICKGFDQRVINLAGHTNLREFMALISSCKVFLTNDSGPMHLAAALRTPLVALFGSTNDRTTGPYRFGKVIHKHVDCSPCYLRECPKDFRCMKQITVDEVYDAIIQEML